MRIEIAWPPEDLGRNLILFGGSAWVVQRITVSDPKRLTGYRKNWYKPSQLFVGLVAVPLRQRQRKGNCETRTVEEFGGHSLKKPLVDTSPFN